MNCFIKKVFVLFSLVCVTLLISCSTTYVDIKASMPDLSGKPDGVYRGSYDLSGTPVKVVLDVTLLNQFITKINIIKHSCSPIGKKAERIIERVIEQQSLEVDVISGATGSSKSMLMAIENALR
ncbi:MAG: FMN-binding protein [Treponema sp.]|jgi:uncharacterized protein with FMN-binding domain|nr:FMN-binding protein [Treponema sp.]